jgi:ketosteroid isomerase-like protein
MKKVTLLTALLCLLFLSCCQKETKLPETYQDDVCNELSELSTLFYEAWANEDLDSVLFFLDKDFLNMFAYGPITNLDENIESFRDVFDTYSIEDVKYEETECLVDHIYAFTTGWFEQKWITNDMQDTISFKMRGMDVWRKQEDGSWKIFRLIAQQ